jgi:molybdopterin converting factor small subunit
VLTVNYFAGARAAAGRSSQAAAAPTLAELIGQLTDQHGPALGKVLGACSFLVDSVAWHDRHAPLPLDAVIDVLPPFAGG